MKVDPFGCGRHIVLIFYSFAAISICLGLVSLRGGVRFVRYVHAELGKEYPEFTPFVTVFVPCRGLDEGLKENINAIFAQDYPAFEIVFVTDRADDPALAIIEAARRSFADKSGPTMRFVISGPATDSGQKVHNLRAAVAEADPQSELFVFVDTDARPSADWLHYLVRPLQDPDLGATTGYRWFVPVRGGVASHLRSVWNAAIASALGERLERNFCWGGSTAIRRETFNKRKVVEYWRGTVSDDFALTRALHEGDLPIKFVPQCLTASFEDCTFGELLEFTIRQLKITRAYAAHLWRGVLIGSILFVLVFFGGIALVVVRAWLGLSFMTPLVLLLIILALGSMKSHFRLRAVAQIIPDQRMRSLGTTLAQLTLWPLASVLYLYNALAAAVSRRITWRGITYELKSPNETVILSREPD
ncbi:MAG TPA: glycosyltransferase family 2 protein [Pyrinomonadaceae bacterium]|nr:glycosyltransferase family 2 protein [Pyrinomonadaceae bacterium]